MKVLGVTLSREQATWAQEAIKRDGLDDVAEVRHLDYRDVTETGFDAISSIGLTEHIGVKQLPGVLRASSRTSCVPGGRLLNHCITRAAQPARPSTGAFIDRYIFPDGELTGSGRIITEMQDVGLEVRHEENLREHYAMTCRAWAPQPGRATGTSASRRRGGHRPRLGHVPRRLAASASISTTSSCTRCWR